MKAKLPRDPKSISGARKPPLHLVPPVANILEALVLKSGAETHGPWNWRHQPIELMEHLAAVDRHLAAFKDRETFDRKTRLNHLAHARATLGIILDAEACGTLIDDRPPAGGAARAIAKYTISRKEKKRHG